MKSLEIVKDFHAHVVVIKLMQIITQQLISTIEEFIVPLTNQFIIFHNN
jgi:hypothetical protein